MLRNVCCKVSSLSELNAIRINSLNRRIFNFNRIHFQILRSKKTNPASVSSLFKPVDVRPSQDENNVGAEITGTSMDKNAVTRILNRFVQLGEVRMLCLENGLDVILQQQAFSSFRRFCREAESLPADLHIVFSDIHNGAGHVADIFPYFLRHAKQIFPHLDCMDDLKKISDLREPANWYQAARAMNRKIIFHSGPTNSGKTYHAMERFLEAKSGIYCGPLKLLATEVYQKSNQRGTPCDLVTGEERSFAFNAENPSSHVACTVEMTSLTTPYEVAIIDEIQQIRDPQRGWAWTRALLGLMADEIHVCGEFGAVELIKRLCETMSEDVDVKKYNRLTPLTVEKRALTSLKNVMPGDCIVCFSKNDIYTISKKIEALGKEVAIIYGTLPPGTKLAQAAKFNDPANSCKIMVATDAIGMGLNLSIRRIIFYSLIKTSMNEKGEREMDVISVSSALQIAGRAGRFGTQWEEGYVTTFKPEDLPKLTEILAQSPEPLVKAGLHPTADQIELYAYHLPNSTLSNLMDIFVTLSTLDDYLYFICNTEDFKFLAEMIQHVPLPLKARYIYCCAPINKKMPFVCSMFLKIARQFSKGEPITFNWLCGQIGWPFSMPRTILDLVHLESVFDVLDLYLWLSYRFVDLFPEAHLVRDIQKELDEIIQQGVIQLTRLLQNSESVVSSGQPGEEGDSNQSKENFFKDGRGIPLRGRLTERLLAQGLLTPSMLQELRKEWDRSSRKESESDGEDERDHNSPFAKKKPRRVNIGRKLKKF